ncbi:MAG: leucine-rich repeat domain-containing protein [Clostridia bacterium]|nr:leucine-rich repeat domain-containing protein [Clostridia bacterium]
MLIKDGVLEKVSQEDIREEIFEVPEGIIKIGDYAFDKCSKLIEIKIPEDVIEIGEFAFQGCSNLEKIKLPKGVTKISNGVFLGCSSLIELEIPEGVTEIGYDAFAYCSNLTKIKIPDGVTEIGYEAFSHCLSLTEIKIPEAVTEIGNSAFSYCSSLTNIKIPEGVTEISNDLFYYCSRLAEINIPEGVTDIGNYAFCGCSRLEELKIPEGVIEIGAGAFRECSMLIEIKLPEKITKINDAVFSGCSRLTDIKIPEGVTEIGDYAFKACSGLTKMRIPEGVTKISKRGFSSCSGLREIKIPEGVTEISEELFWECTSLKEIQLSEGVTKISDGAFSGCLRLEKIQIPEGVTEIGDAAFECCLSLTKIKIPEKVNVIASRIFFGCASLKEIEISEEVTKISDGAFFGCSSITEIKLPEQVNMIGREAFSNCFSLKKIKIPKELTNIGLEAIKYNNVTYDDDCNIYLEMNEKNNKNTKYIPMPYLMKLKENNNLFNFLKNSDFKNFNSNIKNLQELLQNETQEEKLDFFKFVVSLGCFSNEKLLDKNGKETETAVSQKASSLLAQLLKTEELKIGKYHGLFDSMPFDIKVDQDFIKFLAPNGKNNENLEMLVKLEAELPGIFVKTMSDFNSVKEKRVTLAEDGSNKTIPWEDAIKKHYYSVVYSGITKENEDISLVFAKKGVSQNVFDEAVKLRKKAQENNVPEHILNKQLKEDSIIQQIEKIKNSTEAELGDVRKVIDDLYKRNFSYEWLSKKDPENGIMGLYASCCASLSSAYYGKKIAENTIIAENVQNLVVRGVNGEIIAKGTMYVNEKEGYGVFNDFEINSKYKQHEERSGFYSGDDKEEYELSESERKDRNERDLIFSALIRGMNAFVEEYDIQHPERPMQQINVGMGYNRLKRNVMEFEKATNNLSVPVEYSFIDAEDEQYILYNRTEKNKQIEENEK